MSIERGRGRCDRRIGTSGVDSVGEEACPGAVTREAAVTCRKACPLRGVGVARRLAAPGFAHDFLFLAAPLAVFSATLNFTIFVIKAVGRGSVSGNWTDPLAFS